MARLLIHYGKTGPLKYLSHLELIRAFERAFRRAQLNIVLSGGFSPRPKISYGSALSVGVASIAEYMTIDLEVEIEPDDIFNRIYLALPEGLEIYKAKYIFTKSRSIASAVQSYAYSVKALKCPDNSIIDKEIKEIITEEHLLARHKDKEKWVETRKAVLDWKTISHIEKCDEQCAKFNMLLSAEGSDTVRPEVLMRLLYDRLPAGYKCETIEILRTGQYVNRDVPLVDIYNFYESVKIGSEHK